VVGCTEYKFIAGYIFTYVVKNNSKYRERFFIYHHHNALKDLGLMACSDLIFTNPIVFSVDVPGFFSLMVGSSGYLFHVRFVVN
jgi:hypothetical protein